MSGRAWMCSVCTQLPAVSFCCCGATETFLCPLCYSGHISKFPTRFHMNLSIACYGNHRNPGFLEQLQARAAALPTKALTLQRNLSTIDECIQALNLRTREFIDSLTSEAQEITKELQALRSKLEGEISAAVTEAEATMMQSDAPDISVLGKLLRDCSIPVERLTLFSYALEREPVSLLRKSLKFELSEPRFPPVVKQAPAANAPNQHPPDWDQMNRKEKKAWKRENKK